MLGWVVEGSSMRKLAAIMFTDIVGFTALAAKDEEKALEKHLVREDKREYRKDSRKV